MHDTNVPRTARPVACDSPTRLAISRGLLSRALAQRPPHGAAGPPKASRGHYDLGFGELLLTWVNISNLALSKAIWMLRLWQRFRAKPVAIRIGRFKIRRNGHLKLDRARSAGHNYCQSQGSPLAGRQAKGSQMINTLLWVPAGA